MAVYTVLLGLSIFFFNGTGDSGDSVAHYLFARYAPQHLELYFHHWAKPVYVLLASPFAQFGITGIKIFNSLITLSTIFFTYKIAIALNLKNAILAAIICLLSPLYYILTLSGLTEPLFALFTALGIYMCLKHHFKSACVLISFLPYVRSEGLIIIGIFSLYLILKNKWLILPYLGLGSVTYSIAGYFVHHDFLWVFAKIPYAKLSSVYGSGTITHFAEQLINVLGVPIYALFWIGLIRLLVKMMKRKLLTEESVLIALGFLAFFMAHTLFWYLGIFNSMGLKRVMLGIMPMMAIIALHGFNFLIENLANAKPQLRKILYVALISYMVIFPFSPNPSAIQWEKDMCLEKRQQLATETAEVINQNKKAETFFVYNEHYFSVIFNLDHFDNSKTTTLNENALMQMKPGDILIWDNLYSLKESEIKKTRLDTMESLTPLCDKKIMAASGEINYVVYQKR